MKKLLRISMCVLSIGLFMTSCSKYDEGPNLSLYSKGKRIQGTWYFSHVTYNDIDSTEAFQQSTMEFLLGEGSDKDWGIFTWNTAAYSQVFDPNRLKLGGWKLIADKDSFEMVIISDQVEDYDTIQWKINRLAYDEWWMERHIDDTTRILWQLWKWVY